MPQDNLEGQRAMVTGATSVSRRAVARPLARSGADVLSNGEPGEPPQIHEGYYAAFIFEPDGNNTEVVNRNR
jgi:NAD(P)-dependent dehydrogenase (short-subunit alcohol dehydrogenase family)